MWLLFPIYTAILKCVDGISVTDTPYVMAIYRDEVGGIYSAK